MSDRVLAVDLGGTKTSTAIVDREGCIHDKRKTSADHTFEDAVDRIVRDVKERRPDRMGIIVPGIFNPRDGTAWAPNLWGLADVPLLARLTERLDGLPIAIASDRSGYVLGEQWVGIAKGCAGVVFVGIGTGIGAGIIADGKLIEGSHGIAGAVGWMCIDRAWKPEYAARGMWESEAAGPAVARRAGAVSAEEVVSKARTGDAAAVAVLRETAESIAVGVANLISIFDPDMVVLGGGLMQGGDLLLPTIREAVPRWAQPIAAKQVRIELTALGEDAGLLGAALLGIIGR